VGGTWGAIATGLFATAAIGGANGLFRGHPGQVVVQLEAVAASWAWSFGLTFILLKVIDKFIHLHVTEAEERTGLDISQHGERAYET
jgi:Amt family ammonium transporter